jgi:hypothetical protein
LAEERDFALGWVSGGLVREGGRSEREELLRVFVRGGFASEYYYYTFGRGRCRRGLRKYGYIKTL